MTDTRHPSPDHKRSRIRFDPTINLGHVMTGTVFLCSTVAGWMTLDARVTAVEVAGKRADTQTSKDVARIEVALTERIRNNENVLERFGLNYREDLRDVKGALTRIEDKLDKKADKTR